VFLKSSRTEISSIGKTSLAKKYKMDYTSIQRILQVESEIFVENITQAGLFSINQAKSALACS
jgi:hypothetical protein